MKSGLKVLSAVLLIAALPIVAGCACKGYACGTVRQTTMLTSDTPVSMDLPSHAAPGECWAKVFYPPEFKTVSERVCVKEASERLEIIPAEFEWVEEQVCVKPASTQLVEVPAEYETVTQTIVVEPGHTDWVREDGSKCQTPGGGTPVGDVFCLVNFPPVEKTVTAERLVRAASVREVVIPAEFQTIRTQRCVKPASCRRIEIPAEFAMVDKTVQVCPGRWEWQRVICERQASADSLRNLKQALRNAGYTPDLTEETLTETDWLELKKYQTDNRLAVGALTYQTLENLGVSIP